MATRADSTLCLVTFIKVKRLSTWLGAIRAFLRMKRRAVQVEGLLETSMLLRRPRTIIFISLWTDTRAMARFATAVPEHPRAILKLRRARAEIWSGVFTLQSERFSPNLRTRQSASPKDQKNVFVVHEK